MTMLAPVRVQKPASPIVTVAEVKAQSRIDDTESDALIERLVQAATDHLDGWSGIMGRCIVTQTWRQDFCGFRGYTGEIGMILPLGPVKSASIAYLDRDGAEQTLDPTIYALRSDRGAGDYIGLRSGKSWPATASEPDAVRVTFVAGEAVEDVSAAIKHAVIMMVATWWRHREQISELSSLNELPSRFNVDGLLGPLRRYCV